MKNISIIIATVLILISSSFSQAPQAFSYQAVIRDNATNLLTNTTVGMKISIVKDSANGTIIYEETHTPTTNTNGLVSLQAGTGTVIFGTFNTIDWSTGNYYIKSQTDPTGGTAYTISGASKLLSVPYALYAQSASSIASSNGDNYCVKSGDGKIVIITSAGLYGYGKQNSTSAWNYTSYNGSFIEAVSTDSTIVIITTAGFYGYGKSNSTTAWNYTSYNGTIIDHVTASAGRLVIYTTAGLYGYGKQNSTTAWNYRSYNGSILGHISAYDKIVIYTSAGFYGYGKNNSTLAWNYTSYNGTIIDNKTTK